MRAAARMVSLNQCATMRDVLDPPRALPEPTRTSRRRTRLHRGARRFWHDVNSDGRRYHQVLLFALTVAALEFDQVEGAVRACMKQLRDVQPGLRYFWWAELQARGAIHYHGVLVDPTFSFERDARRWFDAHWPHAQIQTWVALKSAAWFRQNDGEYVMKDANKGARKGYEQVYETMPIGWRTFSSHRLAFTAAEHAQHEDKAYLSWGSQLADEHDASPRPIVSIVAIDHHIPSRVGCKVSRDDRLRLRPRRGWTARRHLT